MTKSERTTIFNLAVILFNIVTGLAVELVIIAILFVILHKNPNLSESVPMQVILPFLLLIGLIIAMSISVRVISWAIDKFNLKDKVDSKAISRYQKK